jgi:pseudoazurin
MTILKSFSLAASLMTFALGPAFAETIEVKMLNRGQHGSMVFEPDFIALKPGDTVQFRVGHKSHNAASIGGMVPDGYTGFKGKIDEEIAVTFDKPGYYGIKCSPHIGMGMVMIVRVGDVTLPDRFLEADIPARAKQRFEEILKRTEVQGQ